MNSRLGEHYSRYLRPDTSESNNDQYKSNDISTVFSTEDRGLSVTHEPSIQYEKTDNYLIVNSKDRDTVTYPSSSQFVITLDKEYRNISSVELIQAIVPDKNNITQEPYLLLNVKELENTMDSNNKQIYESFAILQTCQPTISGSFLQIDKRIFENVIMKYKTPKANLSKMSISITDTDGVLFNFGGSGSSSKEYQSLFVFKITTLESSRTPINHRNVF